MSVETVLDKISAHNTDVLGCIASTGDAIYDNLPALYDLIDKHDVAEHAANMFEASDALETDHEPFNQLFLEYAEHSIYARRLDDGVLLLLNTPIARAQFKRMQIGVNLFMKPLRTALARAAAGSEAPLAAEAPEAAQVEDPGDNKSLLGRMYRGVRY